MTAIAWESPLPSSSFLKPLWFVALLLLQPQFTLAETPFELAQKLYEQNNEPEARRALQHELRLRPQNLEARYDLARLLEKIGHQPDAEALYRKNIEAGRHLASMVNLAMILKERGDIEQATQIIITATRKFRNDALPWYLLAELHIAKGQQQPAEVAFKKALKADPLNGFAHLRYAQHLSQHGQHNVAEKHSKRAVALLSECAPCWQQHGEILKAANKPDEARIAFQQSRAMRK